MNRKRGFMLFMAEAPLIGLHIQPGYAPAEEITSNDAEGYYKALNIYALREEALQSAKDTHDNLLEDVEAGNLEDCDDIDDVFEVEIDDAGNLTIFCDDAGTIMEKYHISDVYHAFGMNFEEAKQKDKK